MIKDNDQSSHALQRVRDNCNYFGIFKNNRAVGFHARNGFTFLRTIILPLLYRLDFMQGMGLRSYEQSNCRYCTGCISCKEWFYVPTDNQIAVIVQVGFHARNGCRLVKIMIISLKPIIMLVKKNGFSQVLWVFQKGEMHDFTAV